VILEQKVLDGVRQGAITLAFRRWRRPTVRSGGTLLTAAGQLQIGSVTIIDPGAISEGDAARAGYSSKDVLQADLDRRREGEVYRIEIGPLHPDPRIALRSTPVDDHEAADLRKRLDRLDAASPGEAWTLRTLRAVREHPGVRAADLSRTLGQERDPFKRNVRKLKNLGLTESLEVGYRLSPRGKLFLDRLEDSAEGGAHRP